MAVKERTFRFLLVFVFEVLQDIQNCPQREQGEGKEEKRKRKETMKEKKKEKK